MLTALLFAHVLVGGLILLGAGPLRRVAFPLGAAPMLALLGYLANRGGRVLDGLPVTEHVTWVGTLELSIDLRLDGFGLLMSAVIAGIGVVVMAYGHSYFDPSAHAARIAGLLVWFSMAMQGVVLADNLILLYVAWELTSITSWLLIGAKHTNPAARAGALHALYVTGAGGLVMLAGFVLLAQASGTYSLSGTLAAAPTGTTAVAGLACVLVGVATKSAQYPVHAWLPAAMVAPTPISAYLHSATMVKAGIYLAARIAPVFALTGGWRPAAVGIGLVTMVAGGLRALRQHDLKLLLAMSTVSQLGFMLVLFGAGRPEATVAGATLLLAHALFKAALFLVVGIVDHQAGTRDRRELVGFGSGWATVKAVTLIAAASMAGLPPLFGFLAKESAFDSFAHEGVWGGVVLAGLVTGSVLTFAYSARLAMTIIARPRAGVEGPPAPAAAFSAPAVLLAGLTVVAGLAPSLVEPLLDRAAIDLDARAGASLALWHGFNLPLLLSAVTIAGGTLLVVARARVSRWQAALAPPAGGDEAFAAGVHTVNVMATRVTGVVQNGSLPIYIAVILSTAVALAAGGLLAGDPPLGWPRLEPLAAAPAQLPLAVGLIGAAVAATLLTRRFAAIVVLGAVGYIMALVFFVQGAADLALTQLSIETLFVVLFMLVLRRLPSHFSRPRRGLGLGLRVGVATVVAAAVFVLAMASATHQVPSSVSEEIVERSQPEGDGKNVVNVVLVDVRGLDTLGEISVIAVAGVGVLALARVGRRRAAGEESPP